ncbi:MAG TPA: FAD-dependent oxidoreductase, partial [Caldisericia bacterium]|nr:FAD-dependent oxidoreductase [Caldisericia bacterium]
SQKNSVELEILSKERIKNLEPNLRDDYTKGLFCLDAGIIDPFIATFNLVKNGYENCGDVILDCEIFDLISEKDSIKLITKKGDFETKIFVNSLGFFGKKFLEDENLIFPRRGQYLVTDKNLKNLVSRPIFGIPTEMGKGITVSPTPHGNLLLGPTSHKVSFYNTSSNLKEKEEILEKVNKYIDFDFNQYIIRDFAGVRASSKTKDFIIGYEDGKNIVQVQGIDSPGLTSAPAIAKMVTEIIKKKINLNEKKNFKDYLEPNIKINDLDKNEADNFIQKNNNYGEIICRCEFVSKGEIIDALNSFPKPVNLDGLKRRLRVSSGRCGGSFCTIRIIKILNEYYGLDFTEIKKKGNKSNLVYGEIE